MSELGEGERPAVTEMTDRSNGLAIKTLAKIVHPWSFYFREKILADPIAETKAQIVRKKVADFALNSGIEVPEIDREEAETPFRKEKFALGDVWERARVWETDNGVHFLAVDYSLASIYSPANLLKSGLFAGQPVERSIDQAQKLSRLLLAFFEAQTGTTDMPATAVIKLNAGNQLNAVEINRLRSAGRIGRFGDYAPELSFLPQEDPTQSTKPGQHPEFGSLLEEGLTKFDRSQTVIKLYHGWTGGRWASAGGSGIQILMEGLGQDEAAIIYAGMGAENTEGWKIKTGEITPNDYARQIAVYNEMTGFWKNELSILHSMGGHAGVILRRYYDEARKIASRNLPCPDQGYVLVAPALYKANVFLRGVTGFLLSAAFAKDNLQGHTSPAGKARLHQAIKAVPSVIAGPVEELASRIVIMKYLLKGAEPQMQEKHLNSFLRMKDAAAAQAKGLGERALSGEVDKLLRQLTEGSFLRVIIATKDKLVKKNVLEAIFRDLPEKMITHIKSGHYPQMQPVFGKVGNRIKKEWLESLRRQDNVLGPEAKAIL